MSQFFAIILHHHSSPANWVGELFKHIKDAAKKLESFGFFVGDIINGIGLSLFGPGYRALGASAKSQLFDSSFYWKLSYNNQCEKK